jgi:hypothetical protein
MSKVFRSPPRRGNINLTDHRARAILSSVTPITDLGGISYRWKFVRETRTSSGTLAFVWLDPFNAGNEQVWAVDFNTGACRNIGPARPATPPPVRALPTPPKMLLLPPPSPKPSRKRLAEQIGEAFLRGFRGRPH